MADLLGCVSPRNGKRAPSPFGTSDQQHLAHVKLRKAGDEVLGIVRETRAALNSPSVRPKATIAVAADAFQAAGEAARKRQNEVPKRKHFDENGTVRVARQRRSATLTLCLASLLVACLRVGTPLWWLLSSSTATAMISLSAMLQDTAHLRTAAAASAVAAPFATLKRVSGEFKRQASQRLTDAASPESGTPSRKPPLRPAVSFSRRKEESDAATALPAAAQAFVGTWSVEAVEASPGEYDGYLRKLGVGWALRRLAPTLRPEPTYTIEDGVLHGRTPGMGGVVLHDIFATGKAARLELARRLFRSLIASGCFWLRRDSNSSRHLVRSRW